jgi:hypothetical protein
MLSKLSTRGHISTCPRTVSPGGHVGRLRGGYKVLFNTVLEGLVLVIHALLIEQCVVVRHSIVAGFFRILS